jgi:hypothetical protein
VYSSEDWIAISPEGYYNASPGGDRYLNVRIGNDVFGIDQFRSVFYRPDLISMALSGQRDAFEKTAKNAGIQEASSFAPPQIAINSEGASRGISVPATASSPVYKLTVSVKDKNQPLKSIQILVNGKRQGSDVLKTVSGSRSIRAENAELRIGGNERSVDFSLTVDLDRGENRIEVVAANGFAEARKQITVFCEPSSGEVIPLPDLWILAVGINDYNDSSIPNLNYCVNDAKEFIETFSEQEGRRYRKINSLLVADSGGITPTVKNIRDNFSFFSKAGSRDVIVLFIAGHGLSDEGGNFYYLPKDAAFAPDGALRKESAISYGEILAALNSSGNRLVFIDACHSGGLSGKTGAVDNNRLVRSLMESNAFIFTSSRGNELSQELDRYRHGVFTYSLIQGLKGAAESGNSGRVSMLELSAYVSREVKDITNDRQHPSPFTLGFNDFDLAVQY